MPPVGEDKKILVQSEVNEATLDRKLSTNSPLA